MSRLFDLPERLQRFEKNARALEGQESSELSEWRLLSFENAVKRCQPILGVTIDRPSFEEMLDVLRRIVPWSIRPAPPAPALAPFALQLEGFEEEGRSSGRTSI